MVFPESDAPMQQIYIYIYFPPALGAVAGKADCWQETRQPKWKLLGNYINHIRKYFPFLLKAKKYFTRSETFQFTSAFHSG